MNLRNRDEWVLPAILALGLGLRCVGLNSRGIIYDDAFSILLASRNLTEIVAGTAVDTMPPLFYFLLHFWLKISRELWFVRLLPIVLNLATVAVLYYLASALAGKNAGRGAALAAAVMPLQLYHAQDVRMYALVLFFETTYALFFYRLWIRQDAKRKWWDWTGLILAGTAALYSHNLAAFGLAAANVILLLRRRWRSLFELLATQAVTGILFIPWLVMLPGQIQKIQTAFWTPSPGVVEVVQALIQFGPNLPLPDGWIEAGTVLAVLLVVITGLETWRDRKTTPNLDFMLAYALTSPLALFLVSYIMRPVFVARGFLAASIGIYSLIGRVMMRRTARGAAFLLLGVTAASAALGIWQMATFAEFPRSPFREAAEALASSPDNEVLVLHDNKLSAFPMAYFAPELNQHFLADAAGSPNDTLAIGTQDALNWHADADVQAAAAGVDSLVFVVFDETIAEYRLAGQPHPVMAWLNQYYRLTDRKSFNDLQLLWYMRR